MNATWQALRAYFPVLEKRPYFNTAFAGLIHPIVEEKLVAVRKQYMQELTHYRLHEFEAMKDEIRTLSAEILGVSASNMALLHNYSSGMNVITQNLKNKKVMMMREDYPSLYLPFQTAGFEITYIGEQQNGKVSYAEIEAAIKAHQPPYFAISQVHYNSGWCVDLVRISAITKKYGVKLIVDGTQAFGAIETNLNRLHVDAYLASTYKWLMGGYGAGIAYISEALLADFSFCMASQNNLVFDDDGAMHYEPGIKMFEPGHKDHEVFGRLLEALKLTQQLGISNIEARIRALSVRLSTGLKAQSVELIGDPDLDDFDRANILCIPNKKEYAEALAASKIDCSVRGKAIRFSIHAYNNEEDVDALLAVFSK